MWLLQIDKKHLWGALSINYIYSQAEIRSASMSSAFTFRLYIAHSAGSWRRPTHNISKYSQVTAFAYLHQIKTTRMDDDEGKLFF